MRRLIFFGLLLSLLAAGCAAGPKTSSETGPRTNSETSATVIVYRAPT